MVSATPGDGSRTEYWLDLIYNDWNNIHEGDWEMAQVVFDVSTAEQALQTAPTGMAVSQHYGNERRPWADVTRVGDRPVILAAAGSHAIYYSAVNRKRPSSVRSIPWPWLGCTFGRRTYWAGFEVIRPSM